VEENVVDLYMKAKAM